MKLNLERNERRTGWVRRHARRYGLFTLVGIAGEDDVDAPDLAAPTQQPLGRERLKPGSNARLDSEDRSGGPGDGTV